MTPLTIILALAALGIGVLVGYLIRQYLAKKQLSTAEGQAAKIIEEAKNTSNTLTLEAKNKAVEILEGAKKNEQSREEKIGHQETRLEKREEQIEKEAQAIDDEKKRLLSRAEEIQAIKAEIEKLKQQEVEELQRTAKLSHEEAESRLMKLVEEESKDALVARMSKLENEAHDELEKRSFQIMATIIQKYSRTHVSEFTTTTITFLAN
jgi:ribonuclease Y